MGALADVRPFQSARLQRKRLGDGGLGRCLSGELLYIEELG